MNIIKNIMQIQGGTQLACPPPLQSFKMIEKNMEKKKKIILKFKSESAISGHYHKCYYLSPNYGGAEVI